MFRARGAVRNVRGLKSLLNPAVWKGSQNSTLERFSLETDQSMSRNVYRHPEYRASAELVPTTDLSVLQLQGDGSTAATSCSLFIRDGANLGVSSSSVFEILERTRRTLLFESGSNRCRTTVADLHLEHASRCMCLIKGDAETFWHMRKRGLVGSLTTERCGIRSSDRTEYEIRAVSDELHLSEVCFRALHRQF